MRHDVIAKYNLPRQVLFCKKCTLSNQRPRTKFDEHGVCAACNYAVYKKSTDWAERERQLLETLARFRRNDGSYDCVVPLSGGKDGSFVAHQLKYKYGMNPLTVTWAPNLYTDIGRRNLDALIDSGFDNVLGRPSGLVNRKLVRLSFEKLGDPFQAFIYGQTNFPLRMAVQHGIQLIMYGENGEVEYGGDMKNAERPTRDITDHDRHYFSNFPPEYWREYDLSDADLHPYTAPPAERVHANKTEIHFFGYYKCWDPQENFYYCVKNTGFVPNDERSEGTYSKYASLDDRLDGFHYYLGYIKFGIGRTTSDSAHEVRDGKITREEAVALVRRYDGEFPKRHYKEFLEYAGIDDDKFWEVVDSWRSDHIWEKAGNEWRLKHRVE
jgi:N-acetyl sugar amidotransferase